MTRIPGRTRVRVAQVRVRVGYPGSMGRVQGRVSRGGGGVSGCVYDHDQGQGYRVQVGTTYRPTVRVGAEYRVIGVGIGLTLGLTRWGMLLSPVDAF